MTWGRRAAGRLIPGLMTCCTVLSAPAVDIRLPVRETAGVARRGGIVSAGIPFAKGAGWKGWKEGLVAVNEAAAEGFLLHPAAPDAFLVAAADTCMNQPSADLMAKVYPEVPIRKELAKHETLLSIEKARSHLGYEPEHSWRDYITLS